MGRRMSKRVAQGKIEAELKRGQWYGFHDYNGYGYCQTDLELHLDGYIILLEVKLTQTACAVSQLTELYLPVLKALYQVPVIPVQVCRAMREKPENLLRDIEDLIKRPAMLVWTWHYLGER